MTFGPGIRFHLELLWLASLLAFYAWRSEDDHSAELALEVWGGQASQIEQIEFDAPDTTAILSQHKDAAGPYWVVWLDSKENNPPAKRHGASTPPDGDDSPEKWVQESFISVDAAMEFAGELAPLRALRALGSLPEERVEEFGLDAEAPKKSLTVQFSESTEQLTIGRRTPGRRHLYARSAQVGESYVLGESISGTLSAFKSRLMQRALHSFDAQEVRHATIVAGDARRALVRFEGKGRFWADAASKAEKDESSSNWMSKLEQLSAKKYVEVPPSEPTPIVRVALADRSGNSLGFVELAKIVTGSSPDETEYYARSETTRWWVSVSSQTASQLEQDFATVLSD